MGNGNASRDEPASSSYWKRTDGFVYQELIRQREREGNPSYRQQESFLAELVAGERDRRGRHLDVLEFGCGFGRHAAYLTRLAGVAYTGYDFSESMLAPLRAHLPQRLGKDRVLCGPSLAETAGGRTFDLIFTVSVLIHNPPERVPSLLAELAAHLAPGGVICLIENQVVPFSVWENQWHDGCWLHAYAGQLGDGWDLYLVPDAIEEHHVYLFRRSEGDQQRIFRAGSPSDPLTGAQPMSAADLAALGASKLERWAGKASEALRVGAEAATVREQEGRERLQAERRLLERRHRLARLADDLAAFRSSVQAAPRPAPKRPAPRPTPALLVDAALDTTWASRDGRFSRVTHVFHQEWHGIRAAAGYLPGRKVAIAATRALSPAELRQAVDAITVGLTTQVVIHSHSPNMLKLIRMLRRVAGDALGLHVVWHGSTAQFHVPVEIDTFAELVALRRSGEIDSISCVKADMHELSPLVHPVTLLNLPPTLRAPPRSAPTGAALIPVPNDWRKNFHTNLFAGARARGLERIFVTTPAALPPGLPVDRKVIYTGPLERAQLFRVIGTVDVILNASLSECQPMTALEGLALGVPCITGPLSLGELDRHPYQQLVQVAAVDSVAQVRASIERVLAHDRAGLAAIMDDYRALVERTALQRFGELLNL